MHEGIADFENGTEYSQLWLVQWAAWAAILSTKLLRDQNMSNVNTISETSVGFFDAEKGSAC